MATLKVNNETIVIAPENLPAATTAAKGAVKQGASVVKDNRVYYEYDIARKYNDLLDSLRQAGVIANDKFVVIYDTNYEDNDNDVFDNSVYENGDTTDVLFETYKGEAPSRDGYNFLGWSTNKNAVVPEYSYSAYEGGTEYTLNITGDVVLYAVWELATYTLTYSLGQYGQGSVPAAQTVIEGAEAEISFSPAPTVNDGSGRVFVGWAHDDGVDTIDSAAYRPDGDTYAYFYSDTTLYPVFAAQRTLTYALGNDATGTVPAPQTVYNGQYIEVNFNPSVTCISDPTKVFIGWSYSDESSDADFSTYGDSEIYMNNDFTLYPVFGTQVSADTLLIENNGREDVVISHYDSDSGEYVTDMTISSYGSATLNIDPNISYAIFFRHDEDTSTREAHFSGSYNGASYQNDSLTIGFEDDEFVICDPNGDGEWDGSASISGTLTVNSYSH